jgi:hypothetical protein
VRRRVPSSAMPRDQGSRACRRGPGRARVREADEPMNERTDDATAAPRIVWADGPHGWHQVREPVPGDPRGVPGVPIVPIVPVAERMVCGLLELGELIEDAELAELKVREHLLNLDAWSTLVTVGFLLSTRGQRRRRGRRRKKGISRG